MTGGQFKYEIDFVIQEAPKQILFLILFAFAGDFSFLLDPEQIIIEIARFIQSLPKDHRFLSLDLKSGQSKRDTIFLQQ